MGPDMEIIKDYFKPNTKLMGHLERSNQTKLQKQQVEISELADISVIYQSEPRGLGDAILLTQQFIGYDPFLVVLPDDLVFHETSASQQLVNSRKNREGTFVALTPVQNNEIPKKGIISGHELQQNFYKITHMIEKPSIKDAPSNLSILGRYILTNEIFDALRDTKPGKNGEIQLTDGINLLRTGTDVYGVVLDGHHIDVGNPSGMMEAMLRATKEDNEMRKTIKSIVSKW
jgi:UTP--glucose-1-phosphate uridylyltransferase